MSYINVAQDFSKTPFGRNEEDGPNNGTRFREKLISELKKSEGSNEPLIIDFSGITLVLGSSFIEEAFGGLVRLDKIEKGTLLKRLKIISKTPLYEIQIKKFISEAKPN
jgi:hypothetical protein